MKYLTLVFYVLALALNLIAYGLIVHISALPILEILFVIGNLFFMVYWIIILRKSNKIEPKAKTGYIVGLIFITFVYAPLLAFKLDKSY
ncbi:MAG: hypothetical protein ACJAXI_003149 [Crocinitomicaceae bacterium]|jgi:hypothetical protein